MRIHEIVFQGLFGCNAPVRIAADQDVSTVVLPPGVSSRDVQDLIISVFYPDKTPQKLTLNYSEGESRAMCLFSQKGRRFRLMRKGRADNVRLQAEESGEFKDLAQGDRVEGFLRQSMGLPEFESLWSLNFWRFDHSPASIATFDIEALDPRKRDIVLRYREARAAEMAEDKLKNLEFRIAEKKRELGQGMALEEKLQKAREKLREIELSELSAEDIELLQQREILFNDFRGQIERLAREEDAERVQVFELLPDPVFKNPIFVAGLVIGVIAIGTSIAMAATPWRSVVLVNAVGFGMCAWALLGYFSSMERANVHQVRQESIKRRLNQVREEQVSLQERINHILIHARMDDATDVGERVARAQKLKGMIDALEAQVNDLRRDPAYVRGKTEVDRLQKELEAAKAERIEVGPDSMSAYQLESDLEVLGIDPISVATDSEVEEDSGDPLLRVLDALKRTQQWENDALYDKTRRMWAKIAGFLLGDRFKDVDLHPDGTLKVGTLGAEQVAMWARTRPSEHQALVVALAIAGQVNAPARSARGTFDSIVVQDPSEWLTGEQAKKIHEVFSSAAQRTPVLLLREKQS